MSGPRSQGPSTRRAIDGLFTKHAHVCSLYHIQLHSVFAKVHPSIARLLPCVHASETRFFSLLTTHQRNRSFALPTPA